MYIFKETFTAKSKRNNEPFYNVKLFARLENKDKKFFFKEVSLFVEKDVFEEIVKQGFSFGDIVEVVEKPSLYLGGPSQLAGLKLVEESPYL